MVKAWFMDDDEQSDQRLEHHRQPPEFIDLKDLFESTGVEHFHVCNKASLILLNTI